jgi:hypothetical protein
MRFSLLLSLALVPIVGGFGYSAAEAIEDAAENHPDSKGQVRRMYLGSRTDRRNVKRCLCISKYLHVHE